MNSFINDLKFKIDLNEEFENRLINFQGNPTSIINSILSKLIPGLKQSYLQRIYFDHFLIQQNLSKEEKSAVEQFRSSDNFKPNPKKNEKGWFEKMRDHFRHE